MLEQLVPIQIVGTSVGSNMAGTILPALAVATRVVPIRLPGTLIPTLIVFVFCVLRAAFIVPVFLHLPYTPATRSRK